MKQLLNFIKDNIKPLVIIILICILFSVFFRPAIVDGSSMYPTLKNDDILILRKSKNVKFGDIVAIMSDKANIMLCKRVIGVGGDKIIINETGLYVNDELIHEDYLCENLWLPLEEIIVEVPENQVFVMGDNRNNSVDSRILGCIEVVQIRGILCLDFTKYVHINSKDYKIVLYLLWLILIGFYIVDFLVRRNKNHKDNTTNC